MSLYTRSQDWVPADKLSFGSVRTVPWISWSKERGTTLLFTMSGVDYVNASFEVSCNMKLNNTDQNQIAVFAFQAQPLTGRYVDGTVLDEMDRSTVLNPQTSLTAFQNSNGKLSQVDLRISNEEKNVSPFRLYCKDVNGDGNSDIVVSDWRAGKSPYVYINSGSGSLLRVNPSNLPNLANPDYSGEAFTYNDLNGDGFADFISYPTAGLTQYGMGKSVILKLHRGGRHARSGDFM